jgi:DNA-binding LacI/PurR family transcriptional regulator
MVFAGGLYAQGDASHRHYERVLERKLPIVLVNAAVECLDFPQVSCDDVAAAEIALAHLMALGHTRVAMLLGPADHVPSQRKLAAFRAYAKANGLELPAVHVEHTMFSLEGGHAAAARMVRRGITGIICASDVLALGAIRAARRAGLSVPEDVSVIGYDDSALMSCIDPPLTTVRQPIDAMGRAAVELLVAQIDAAVVPGRELLFEPELVVRACTGRPAVPPA